MFCLNKIFKGMFQEKFSAKDNMFLLRSTFSKLRCALDKDKVWHILVH